MTREWRNGREREGERERERRGKWREKVDKLLQRKGQNGLISEMSSFQ